MHAILGGMTTLTPPYTFERTVPPQFLYDACLSHAEDLRFLCLCEMQVEAHLSAFFHSVMCRHMIFEGYGPETLLIHVTSPLHMFLSLKKHFLFPILLYHCRP